MSIRDEYERLRKQYLALQKDAKGYLKDAVETAQALARARGLLEESTRYLDERHGGGLATSIRAFLAGTAPPALGAQCSLVDAETGVPCGKPLNHKGRHGTFRPVLTIYDTETEYVTRKGFEKLLRRVEALEKALDGTAPPAPVCGCDERSPAIACSAEGLWHARPDAPPACTCVAGSAARPSYHTPDCPAREKP